MGITKTDITFMCGIIIAIIGVTLLLIFLPKSTPNPYAPYLCHGNITNTTNITAACYNNPQYQDWNAQQSVPIYDIIFLISTIIGIGIATYALLTQNQEIKRWR